MEELPAILDHLKSTVECLSMSTQTNTWEVCGGLDRLHSIMMNIFSHGCLTINTNAEDAVWHFIQGLNWLHPTIASLCTFSRNTYPKNEHLNKSSIWIYKSLENHSLSEKLGFLLSDKDHLYKCYKPEAFLCQKEYSDAALLCLRVVELNQPSLLLEINPKLYLNSSSKNEHCTTLPKLLYKQTHSKYFEQLDSLTNILTYKPSENTKEHNMNPRHHNDLPKHKIKHLSKRQCYKSWPDIYKTFDQLKLRRSLSFDTLHTSECSFDCTHKNATIGNTAQVTLPKLLDVNYEQLLNDNENLNKHRILNSDLPKRTKRRSKLFTLPLKILEESDDDTRSNISESRTLIPYDEFPPSKYVGTFGLVSSYFPDQDLFKFLSSGQFLQANAELDRENAHFKISEAIIGTIEQIKCNQKLKFADEVIDESDEEINRLKHRIRCRRKQKLQIEQTPTAGTSSSDCLTESTMSSLTSSYCSTTSSMSTTDDLDEFELDDDSISSSSMFSVCSSSAGSSSYLNADQMRSASVCSTVTAESVARSLIRQISQKNNWPVDVNVQWLISENDVPQRILPLPSSWPVNPYESTDERSEASSRLRGTSDWAPPRPQIIFTSHPSPIRKNIMELQGYRCAGCGMKVAVKYASKFRYCFYLGRYFCTGCHVDKTAIIPGRIIGKWDFSKYPVSCFSFNLLEKMLFDPLFNITDLNSVLYKRARGLDKVRMYRMQLYYIKDFIFLCRYADRLKELLEIMDAHIILKPDLYSIQNLVDVKNGELGKKLQNLIAACNKHVFNCQLCQARGFVCEICNNNKILFPWDFRFVTRCVDCGSCYHKKCYDSRKVPMCPRCPRIMAMFKRTETQNDQNTVVQS